MSDWTSGYVADVGYTYGYYTELNPLRSQLAFLIAGLLPPKMGTHCELGFGQGVSINIHAAATHTHWYGTDFNPAQAGFAQELQGKSEAFAKLFDEDFKTFCSRPDLPDFDSISLHGTWSWISDTNRAVIVDFVRRKLKVGGVLYISYNTQPGWAPMIPVRGLLTDYANSQAAAGQGILARIEAALGFMEQVLAVDPAYMQANATVTDRLSHLKTENLRYLAHEYFNHDWSPMSFSKMADWLAPAKLDYACSANYLDVVNFINLSPEQQQLIDGISDPIFRQSVRDFCVNQHFRKDYWVKGARTLSSLEQLEALRAIRVILVLPMAEISLSITTSLGEIEMDEAIYNPILDIMADHQARSLADLEQSLLNQLSFPQLLQAVLVLSGLGALMSVQARASIDASRASTDRLNNALLDRARFSNDIYALASPVTGGGILLGRSRQLFLLALQQGIEQPADWSSFAWEIMAAEGHKLSKDGITLEAPEDNIKELNLWAELFAEQQLPILRALKVI